MTEQDAIFVDEDVPGAASGYILDQILVKQKGS